MSDPFLTEFWAKAPPPWNTLGPEIAVRVRGGIVSTPKGGFPNTAPPSKLILWSKALREARKEAGLTQVQVAYKCGIPDEEISLIETDKAGRGARGWEKLAAFYGITLE